MATKPKPPKPFKPNPPAPQVDAARVVRLFKVASDPTRVQILGLLADRDYYVNELCDALDTPQPLTSHHLRILQLNGVAEAKRARQHTYYALTESGKRLVAAIVHVAT